MTQSLSRSRLFTWKPPSLPPTLWILLLLPRYQKWRRRDRRNSHHIVEKAQQTSDCFMYGEWLNARIVTVLERQTARNKTFPTFKSSSSLACSYILSPCDKNKILWPSLKDCLSETNGKDSKGVSYPLYWDVPFVHCFSPLGASDIIDFQGCIWTLGNFLLLNVVRLSLH